MSSKTAFTLASALSLIGFGALILVPALSASALAAAPAKQAAGQTIAKRIGTIKAINGSDITLAPESGPEIAVTIQPNARLIRLAPGEKDVKNAAPIQLQDLQVGDTVRVRGYASDDAKSFPALEVLVITRSAVAAVSQQIREDWQKRGLAGPVTAVDPAAGTVTIAVGNLAAKKEITVQASKNTIVRRYAPDSAKFEDAKPSTLQEIRVGDQLRARGAPSADGNELAAEEIVTGSFPNIAGLIKSVDASAGTLSVQDLLTKKTVTLKITPDSQLHKIPEEMANRFAMRLKATMPAGMPGAAANSSSGSAESAGANRSASQAGAPGGSGMRGAGAGGARPGGGFDLQRLLDQTPTVALSDLHKGDAVAILATEGTPAGGSTVVKLFSGVEPILQAAPNGSQAMMLAPWTLGGAPGGDAATQ